MMANDEPTLAEQDQAMVAHHDLAEVINRMAREGFTPAILLAALSATAADLITCTVGADAVPKWFASQAMTTDAMLRQAG